MQKAAVYRYARIILCAVYLTAAALIQCSVFPHIRLLGVIPDIALCAVAAVACHEEMRVSCVFAVYTGFLLDVAGGAPYMISPVLFLLAAVISIAFSHKFPSLKLTSALIAASFCETINCVFCAVILAAKGAPFAEAVLHTSLPQFLYTALVFIPVYLLVKLHYTVFKNEKN